MKKFLLFLLISIVFSCQKDETFVSCPEYEKLVGTWKSINGDSKYEITYKEDGTVIEKSEFERAERYKIKKCSFENFSFKMEIYNSKAFIRGCKTNEKIDTISLLMGAYNQTNDTIDYSIYFIKK